MVRESDLVEQFKKAKSTEKPNFPAECLPNMKQAAEEQDIKNKKKAEEDRKYFRNACNDREVNLEL